MDTLIAIALAFLGTTVLMRGCLKKLTRGPKTESSGSSAPAAVIDQQGLVQGIRDGYVFILVGGDFSNEFPRHAGVEIVEKAVAV